MPKLLAVNVGLPQDIQWHGETVHTGIWKRPVQGRCAARRLNLEGDGQGDLAGHGGEPGREGVVVGRCRCGCGRVEGCAGHGVTLDTQDFW